MVLYIVDISIFLMLFSGQIIIRLREKISIFTAL